VAIGVCRTVRLEDYNGERFLCKETRIRVLVEPVPESAIPAVQYRSDSAFLGTRPKVHD